MSASGASSLRASVEIASSRASTGATGLSSAASDSTASSGASSGATEPSRGVGAITDEHAVKKMSDVRTKGERRFMA